jgi:hypothetical protein
MAALGGFKVPDFFHFCRRFKKPCHFQCRLATKKPSHSQKARKLPETLDESGGKSESRYHVSTTHRQKLVGFLKKPTAAKKAESAFSKRRRRLFGAKNRPMSQL